MAHVLLNVGPPKFDSAYVMQTGVVLHFERLRRCPDHRRGSYDVLAGGRSESSEVLEVE